MPMKKKKTKKSRTSCFEYFFEGACVNPGIGYEYTTSNQTGIETKLKISEIITIQNLSFVAKTIGTYRRTSHPL